MSINQHILKVGVRSNNRALKDRAAAVGVSVGGIMVFVALLLIFFYLLYVVKPIFNGAEITPITSIEYVDNSKKKSLMIGTDEQSEVAYRLSQKGEVDFYRVLDGEHLGKHTPILPAGVKITSIAVASPVDQLYALGLSDGSILVVQIEFGVTYPNNIRFITPKLAYPLGRDPYFINKNSPITQFVFGAQTEKISVAYKHANGSWFLNQQLGEENMMTEEIEWSSYNELIKDAPTHVSKLLMTPDQSQLFFQSDNKIFVYDIRYADEINLLQVIDIERLDTHISDVSLLAGASSILISYDNGDIEQYFQVNSDKGRLYQQIRSFTVSSKGYILAPEFYRKSFATISETGHFELFYTTSQRELAEYQFKLNDINLMAFSPRANVLIIDANNQLTIAAIDNSHPEVSWSAIWQKVWYEGYPEPKYIWQSTSGSDDFEAKLSLTPLVFGTVKAAFYALLFAIPLAISGAIYTAYFMSAKVRNFVKPTIEIMEALPTVILGFLAGLWLAPIIENHLPAIVMLMLFLPLSIFFVALAWYSLPQNLKKILPESYKELLLLPVLCLVGWGCFVLSPAVELWFFDGNTREYITNELGITFDQRNAMVVGIAMGFAVIPTIFSIAEDAVFSVPRHLTNGSLALGATPWQTLTKVVLLTASPGIFSAIMMGLGRAVGETMIVLMATGNTPIMDWSVFEGMRTLAANIAVEMPESAIGSTHYRVLFLAAFVLFIFTFIFNTIAEIVRQRLRERYSSL